MKRRCICGGLPTRAAPDPKCPIHGRDAQERRSRQRLVWDRAIKNVGGQSRLARLLGYYSHLSVYNAWAQGSVPKGDRALKLTKLAGPYGKLIAKLASQKKTYKLGKEISGWWHIHRYGGSIAFDEEGEFGPFVSHSGIKYTHLEWKQRAEAKHIRVGGHTYLSFAP